MTRTIITALIIAGLMGCNQDSSRQVISHHTNGNNKVVIELNSSRDTITKWFYREDGTLLHQVPYMNNVFNGVRYTYDTYGNVVEEMLLLDGDIMVVGRHMYDSLSQNLSINYYQRIPEGKQVFVGRMVYDGKRNLLEDQSYFYELNTVNDTIESGDAFVFELEMMAAGRDSIYSHVVLGQLNKDLSVSDTLYAVGQWSKRFKFTVKPKKRGRNCILGTVTTVVPYPELNDYAMDTMIVYKEYYVR